MFLRKLFLAISLTLVNFAAQAEPRTTVVVGMTVEPPGLDPTIAAPVAIGEVTLVNIYEGLTRLAQDGSVEPLLAKSWDISPDGLTYTFHLQEGVTFHDGTPFDSAAVKFTLDRARGDSSSNPQKGHFTPIEQIETPDAATVVLKLKEPAGNLLYWLTWPSAVMVAPNSANDNKINPVGTGPFKFMQWVQGDRVELQRNDGYWNKDKPIRLERVTFRFIGDPQAQAAALQGGDVDAFPLFQAAELFGSFQNNPRFEAVAGTSDLKVVVGLNNERAPFNDKRVRQALQHAIDRQSIIEGVSSGFGQPIGSHYSPSDPGYIDTTGVLPYDLEKAKALLAEAGYGNGMSMTIKAPQMAYAARTSEMLAALFAELGIAVTITPTEFPAKWIEEVFKNKDYEATIIAHAEPLDIGIYAVKGYYFNYDNPAFDKIIAEADSATDDAKRWALYGKAQEMLAEDVPALYVYVLPKLGIWNKQLKGLWHNTSIAMNDLTAVYWEEDGE